MKHLLRLLKDSSLERNDQLYNTLLALSNYDSPFLTNDDMTFLTTSVFEDLSLYKLFIHIENITSVIDNAFFAEIDSLILDNFGDNELRELKITSMSKLNLVNSLMILLLNIPINTFTINITKVKSSPEHSLENNLPISIQKMLLKNPTLVNANAAINESYRCEKKIDSIDIYIGPPVYYDDFTNTLCLLMNIPSNKLWQPNHNNDGYKTQMTIVNDLNIINTELNDLKLNEITETLMKLQILKIHDIKTAVDGVLIAFNIKQSNEQNVSGISESEKQEKISSDSEIQEVPSDSGIQEETSPNDEYQDNQNPETSNENLEISDISYELRTQLRHILLINHTLRSEKESLASFSMKKLDKIVVAALNYELTNSEIDVSYSPLSSLMNSSLPSDIEICNNLNRITVKSILTSYNNFQNNMPLLQLNTIACPLIYKQFIAIFPFHSGNVIDIIKCTEVTEFECEGSNDVLSLTPHPTYNPEFVSNTVIKKLEMLISFLEFDGNYTNFENVINLIPFDIDDLPSIITIMLSMTNIVYVTVCAAIYTYHMSIFKHYHIQSMYRLTCILGPDAYKLVLNNNINLPIIKKGTSRLHLLSFDSLFPVQLNLVNVPLDEFEDTITNDNSINKDKLNKHFSKSYPEYTVWLYLLSLSHSHKERDVDVIKRENYLLTMLRNTIENPYELYYIKNKLHHNVSELNIKLSVSGSFKMIDFDNENSDKEEPAAGEEITESMVDHVNHQPEQHDVGIIYRYLIRNNCLIQNDVWGLLYFMLRTKNIDKYIECIKCYIDDL